MKPNTQMGLVTRPILQIIVSPYLTPKFQPPHPGMEKLRNQQPQV
ncbi:hypothetical protein ACRYJJ_13500 [Cylindrospermopsis raciborskii G7]|nr:hypothetical protein [Cylindrospermopsis raciborskii]